MVIIINSANGESINFDVAEWDSLLSLAVLVQRELDKSV